MSQGGCDTASVAPKSEQSSGKPGPTKRRHSAVNRRQKPHRLLANRAVRQRSRIDPDGMSAHLVPREPTGGIDAHADLVGMQLQFKRGGCWQHMPAFAPSASRSEKDATSIWPVLHSREVQRVAVARIPEERWICLQLERGQCLGCEREEVLRRLVAYGTD